MVEAYRLFFIYATRWSQCDFSLTGRIRGSGVCVRPKDTADGVRARKNFRPAGGGGAAGQAGDDYRRRPDGGARAVGDRESGGGVGGGLW